MNDMIVDLSSILFEYQFLMISRRLLLGSSIYSDSEMILNAKQGPESLEPAFPIFTYKSQSIVRSAPSLIEPPR